MSAATRRDVDETSDHEVLGTFDIAGPLRMQDGPAEIAVRFVPTACSSVRLGDQLGLTPSELSLQELANEWVHSEPRSVLTHGDDEEVSAARHVLQARRAAFDTEHCITDRAGERVEDGRPCQQPHEIHRQAIQELLSEVVPHGQIDVVDTRGAGISGAGVRQLAHRQAEAGRPALGSLHQPLDGFRRDVQPEHVADRGGLPHREHQVVGLHSRRTTREQQTPDAKPQTRP